MTKMKLFFLAALVSFCFQLKAQEDAHYAQYMFNGLYVNPAYTGSRGGFSTVAMYRQQWMGVENAPRSANVSIHAPIRSGVFSIGAHVNNDRLGVMIMNSAFMTMALRFKLADGENASRFAIGIQGGFKHYNINNQAVNNTLPINDPVFSTNYSGFGINGGWGMYLDAPNYFIGVSMPYMLNNQLNYGNGSGTIKTDVEISKMPIVASAGVVLKASESIKFKPSVLFKYQGAMPINFDLSLGMHIKEVFYIGASYRAENTLAGIAMVNITKGLRVGYAYETSINKTFKTVNTGTHEVMLGFDILNSENSSGNCKCKTINPRQFRYF